MFTLILIGAIITAVMGVALKFYFDKQTAMEPKITNSEFGVAMCLMLVLVIPFTAWVGIKVAIHNQVTYNEYWNGWEVSAQVLRRPTSEDGFMRHYWVETRKEKYWDDEEYTDSDGKKQTRRVQKEKDVDHKIPYTTEEWDFVVHTTIGDVTIATGYLPENPNAYRFRWGVSVPTWKYESTTGYHPYYLTVKDRLDRNNPGPVTLRKTYDNYILASQTTILARFNDSIDKYKRDGMLPKITSAISGYYDADRVYFVGATGTGDWQASGRRFNAALGQTLQGDLHLVIVNADKVLDRDNYAGALAAYWQSPEFGKDALSKNGIVVVLGAKDGKVAWAIATTGMPMGNEHLMLEIRNSLKGVAVDAEELLGRPYATINGGGVDVHNTQGALEKIIWGKNKFQRVHMTDKHGNGVGYEYLLKELKPTGGQQAGILVVVFFLSGLAWGLCIYLGPDTYRQIRERFSRR
jgi:hypothetical protein